MISSQQIELLLLFCIAPFTCSLVKEGLSYIVVAYPSSRCDRHSRQVHLFDIDIPGKIRFQESETLTAGASLTTFSTPWCRVGLGICYDLRFSDMATIYARQGGCEVKYFGGVCEVGRIGIFRRDVIVIILSNRTAKLAPTSILLHL